MTERTEFLTFLSFFLYMSVCLHISFVHDCWFKDQIGLLKNPTKCVDMVERKRLVKTVLFLRFFRFPPSACTFMKPCIVTYTYVIRMSGRKDKLNEMVDINDNDMTSTKKNVKVNFWLLLFFFCSKGDIDCRKRRRRWVSLSCVHIECVIWSFIDYIRCTHKLMQQYQQNADSGDYMWVSVDVCVCMYSSIDDGDMQLIKLNVSFSRFLFRWLSSAALVINLCSFMYNFAEIVFLASYL